MNARQEFLTRLRQISSEHLGVEQENITEESTWSQLGADSLDRLEMSQAIGLEFKEEIPHLVGERLNTVGETVDHLLSLTTAGRREISNIRIEVVTSDQQWTEVLGIRTRVFTFECGFQFRPLPEPGEEGIWHLLARDGHDAVGALSVVDTTGDRKVHQRCRLSFGKNDRVARYAQFAILKPYRQHGIIKMLIETAQSTVIRPNGFAVEWLLYPAARSHSSILTERLGFTAQAPRLKTEFGNCHVLIRRERNSSQVSWPNESFPIFAADRGTRLSAPTALTPVREGL
jgi:acyl carrier protein